MTIEAIKKAVSVIVTEYPISRVVLFGSRAAETNRADSDIDLIIEFSDSVTLLTLSAIKIRLEEMLSLDVDVIHGPIKNTDLIEVDRMVELYAA